MKNIECLNCGHIQIVEKVHQDDMGEFTVCEVCESSFDVNIDTCRWEELDEEEQEQARKTLGAMRLRGQSFVGHSVQELTFMILEDGKMFIEL